MRYETLIRRSFHVEGTSGEEFLCRCPWHDDRGKPNLYVNAASGLFFCHSCGKKGKLDQIFDEVPGVDLADLRKKLRDKHEAHSFKFYTEGWLRQFDFPTDYWTDERGFSKATIRRFNLGYDPITNKAIIPMRDSQGRIVGVISRSLDGTKPKYTFPKGFKKGHDLFGSWLVRKRRNKRVALVEGPLDAIACWDAKVPALALHGARLSEDQATLLKALGITSVVCMTDNDEAGIEATVSIKETLTGVNVFVCRYRDTWVNENGRRCKDPGELTPSRRRHLYLTSEPWHQLLS